MTSAVIAIAAYQRSDGLLFIAIDSDSDEVARDDLITIPVQHGDPIVRSVDHVCYVAITNRSHKTLVFRDIDESTRQLIESSIESGSSLKVTHRSIGRSSVCPKDYNVSSY